MDVTCWGSIDDAEEPLGAARAGPGLVAILRTDVDGWTLRQTAATDVAEFRLVVVGKEDVVPKQRKAPAGCLQRESDGRKRALPRRGGGYRVAHIGPEQAGCESRNIGIGDDGVGREALPRVQFDGRNAT